MATIRGGHGTWRLPPVGQRFTRENRMRDPIKDTSMAACKAIKTALLSLPTVRAMLVVAAALWSSRVLKFQYVSAQMLPASVG